MKCPVDDKTLVITERNDIEIDYCPNCRGVWLDRGELDKLIERSGSGGQARRDERPRRERDYDDDYDDYDDRRRKPRRKKRESFLGELFDF